MRIGCCEACACLSFCFETAKQGLAATVLTLDEIRSNPEAIQKTCILAESIIQGINFYYRTNYLPELVKVLDVAHSFDFYGFCRLPRYLFHPYDAESVDENAILDDLEAILCDCWLLGLPDEQGKSRDPAVRKFAKELLEDLLLEMFEYDYDVRTEEQFKALLHNRIVNYLENNPTEDFDPYSISLKDLKVDLKEPSILELLDDAIFIGVDVACIPAFLQDWSLIDLSFFANQLASLPLLSRLPQGSLDDWIRGVMCVGFIVQLSEAVRSLYADHLTQEEQRHAKWIIAAASAEFLYNSAILLRQDLRLITFLAFTAKSLGLIEILLTPKVSFFS